MQTIKIFLSDSGEVAQLVKDFPLYTNAYQNKLVNVYVPETMVVGGMSVFVANEPQNEGNQTLTTVKIGATYTKTSGSVFVTTAYFMQFVKTIITNGKTYYLYEKLLPQSFTLFAGTGVNAPKIVINVENILRTTEAGETTDTLLNLVSTQETSLDVLPSALIGDEYVEPTELSVINGQINDLYSKYDTLANDIIVLADDISNNSSDITQLQTAVAENTSNIATNTSDIADLNERIATGENYVSTMSGTALPTSAQLNAEVQSVEGRTAQNGDVIIFELIIDNATDKAYKYFYTSNEWQSYEIPPIESAGNGSAGIVKGTYNIGSTNNTQVNIVGGELLAVFVKDNQDTLRDVRTILNETSQDVENIENGTTIIAQATKAIQDGNGNVITTTYMTQANGATKQEMKDYALPRLFNDVKYLSADGFIDDVPTSNTGVQFEQTINSVGSHLLYDIGYTTHAEFELTKKNNATSNIWVGTSVDTTLEFRLQTSIQQNGTNSLIGVELTSTIDFSAGVLQNLNFNTLFTYIGNSVIEVGENDIIRQRLYVSTQDSTEKTITIFSNSVYTSAMYLNTHSTVLAINEIGEPKQVFISDTDFVASGNRYVAVITQSTHQQPIGENYLIQTYSASGTNYNIEYLDFEINTSTYDISVYVDTPQDLRVLIASRVGVQQLGIMNLTNPANIPAVNYSTTGVINITQTIAGSPLTLPNPAQTNNAYKIFVVNNENSVETISINGVILDSGEGATFVWTGSWSQSGDNDITTAEVWDVANNTYLNITLATLSTKAYVDSEIDNAKGDVVQIDTTTTIDTTNKIINVYLDNSISNMEFVHNKRYYLPIQIGISTLSGELPNDYKFKFHYDSRELNFNSIVNTNTSETITVAQACPLMKPYNETLGYSFDFEVVYKTGTGYEVLFITNLQNETTKSMSGQELYNAIVDNTLKVATTVICTSDYSYSGTSYKSGHIYKIVGAWSGTTLLLDTIDITPVLTATITTDTTSGAKTCAGNNNTEYRYLSESGISVLSLSAITIPTIEYAFNIVFNSGSTATTFTNTLGATFFGDDCVGGVFTPLASKSYELSVWYNGIGWYGSALSLGEFSTAPQLSGTWLFNDNPQPASLTQNISFIAYGTASAFSVIECVNDGSPMDGIYYGSTQAYEFMGNTWSNDLLKQVIFGATSQEVSQEFYDWFTANAVKQ